MSLFRIFYLPLFCCIYSFNLFAQHQIDIKAENAANEDVVFGYYFAGQSYVMDTLKTDHKGKTSFKSDTTLQSGLYFLFFEDKSLTEVILNEGNFYLNFDKKDIINTMKTNSKENKAFYEMVSFTNKQNQLKEGKTSKELDKIDQVIIDFKIDKIKKYKGTFFATLFTGTLAIDIPKDIADNDAVAYDYYLAHYLDNIDFKNGWLVRSPIAHARIENYLDNVIEKSPSSVINAVKIVMKKAKVNDYSHKYMLSHLTNKYIKSQIMGLDEVFVFIMDNYWNDEKTANWLDPTKRIRLIDKADKIRTNFIGVKAPNIIVHDTSGNKISLHEIEAEYLAIYFYNSDCGHCKKESPKVHELYQKYKAKKNFKVIAVATDHERKTWVDYINKNKYTWINTADLSYQSNYHDLYNIISTPTLYLLDKDKKILLKRINAEQVEEYFNHLDTQSQEK